MTDHELVMYCAPTLAGLKTAGLFSTPSGKGMQIREEISRLNRTLADKGVRVIPLRFGRDRTLIYIYRPQMLERDFSDDTALRLLKERGYQTDHIERCIARLSYRVRNSGEFPHEIGLFLGYPPEDVEGFIEHRDVGCKCYGCWRVYGDAEKAGRLFEQFDRCTESFCRQFSMGKTLYELTADQNIRQS